ncbi:probable E3 ubiquitin-protein ligase HERC3 [Pristis pectinata]|uniref:probable E3 ubiquitin-protein ligase HERC3 n=1 Tax=Pristis pectinata TaxID=685728 RepID=UPI00223DD717|nr:probable E3 ubiquitin-protein ligase HERC3 [Pristis pectinata]
METSIFHWGELGGRNGGSKHSKAQILTRDTPWGQLADHEEVEHICCSPRFSVFVLKNGKVYTLSNSHKRRDQLELVSVLQEDRIHTVDSRDSNILFISEAGNVYFSKLRSYKRRAAAKSFYMTKPKLLNVFADKCVVQVACGQSHSLALCKDGRIFAWGQNSQGQLGLGKAFGSVHSPQCVTLLAGIPLAQIAAGRAHTIAVSLSGAVFGWGGNRHGQLGLNDVKVRYHPTYVKLLEFKKVIYASCGALHTAVLSKDGLVFTFGAGNYGQLGHNSERDELKPLLLAELSGIKVSQIACGSYHTLAFSGTSGKLYSFGRGENGQLGSGHTDNQLVPRLVSFSMDSPILQEPDPDGVFQPALRRIFAGANQNFALCFGVEASLPVEDQSPFIPLRRILTAEDSLWKTWRTMENGDLQKNIKEQITCIFSSAECLNGSFLETSGDDHFKTSRATSGIDLSAANIWFEKLGKDPILLQEVTNTVEENLIPSLSKSPAGVEALRIYLILPELIEVQREGKNSVKLAGLLSTAIVALEETQLQILESWWSNLNEFFFNKLVNLYRSASHCLLQETSTMQTTFPEELHGCLSILQRLYKINTSRKPKYQENNFYVSPAEVFGPMPVSCKALLELIPYPCIFNMENKIKIFKRLSHLNISNGKIVDESIRFGNNNSTNVTTGNNSASAGSISSLESDVCLENVVASAGDTDRSTGIVGVSTGNTGASTGIVDVSTRDTDTSTGIVDVSTGNTDASTGIVDVSAGNTGASTGIVDVSAGDTDTSTEIIDVSTGNTASTGIVDVSTGNTGSSTGIVDVSSRDTDISAGIVDVSAGNSDISTGIADILYVNTEASMQNTSTFTEITDSLDIDISTNAPNEIADIPNRNTDGSTQIIDASTASTETSTGNITAPTRNSEASTEIIDASTGNIETSTGMIDRPTENTEISTDLIETSTGSTEPSTGVINASAGNTETSTEVMVTSTGNTETSTGIIDVSDGNIEMSAGISDNTDNVSEFYFDEYYSEDDIDYFDYEDVICHSDIENAIRIIETIIKSTCYLHINRTEILQDTLTQLRTFSTTALRGTFRVFFKEELALDEGGVSQEFFSVITKELCNQPKILKQYEESRLVWFPDWDPEIKDVFWLLGILCWLALYHGFVADFRFPLALYKKLLNQQPTLDDLKELSPTVGRNLQELLNYEGDDIEDAFALDFTVGMEIADGLIIEVELIPDGKNIPVQNHNRKLFVDKYVDYVFNTSVEKHFQAFSKGFRSVVPMPVVDLFLPSELMAVLHGNTEYDWTQLEENARYGVGYTKTDEAIVSFWQMFHELTLEEKKHFLAFLTGCDKVPFGGMGNLNIIIREDCRADPDMYFPTAHTCNWILDLPRYSSVEILRERFLRAIGCCRTFGIQ